MGAFIITFIAAMLCAWAFIDAGYPHLAILFAALLGLVGGVVSASMGGSNDAGSD